MGDPFVLCHLIKTQNHMEAKKTPNHLFDPQGGPGMDSCV